MLLVDLDAVLAAVAGGDVLPLRDESEDVAKVSCSAETTEARAEEEVGLEAVPFVVRDIDAKDGKDEGKLVRTCRRSDAVSCRFQSGDYSVAAIAQWVPRAVGADGAVADRQAVLAGGSSAPQTMPSPATMSVPDAVTVPAAAAGAAPWLPEIVLPSIRTSSQKNRLSFGWSMTTTPFSLGIAALQAALVPMRLSSIVSVPPGLDAAGRGCLDRWRRIKDEDARVQGSASVPGNDVADDHRPRGLPDEDAVVDVAHVLRAERIGPDVVPRDDGVSSAADVNSVNTVAGDHVVARKESRRSRGVLADGDVARIEDQDPVEVVSDRLGAGFVQPDEVAGEINVDSARHVDAVQVVARDHAVGDINPRVFVQPDADVGAGRLPVRTEAEHVLRVDVVHDRAGREDLRAVLQGSGVVVGEAADSEAGDRGVVGVDVEAHAFGEEASVEMDDGVAVVSRLRTAVDQGRHGDGREHR